MQQMLDAEMPVSAPKAPTSTPMYWVGVAAVVVTLIGLPFFIMNQPKNKKNIDNATREIPSHQIEHNVAQEEKLSEEGQGNLPVTNEGSATEAGRSDDKPAPVSDGKAKDDVAVESASDKAFEQDGSLEKGSSHLVSESDNIQKGAGDNSKIVASTGATPAAERPLANEGGGETNEVEPTEGIAKTLPALEEIVAINYTPEKEIDKLNEEAQKVVELTEGAAAIEYERSVVEQSDATENPSIILKEGTEESLLALEHNAGEETTEVQNIVPAESGIEGGNDSEPQVEESEEIATAEVATANIRATHLAFLEADEAPMPELLGFSKERFALSLWGGAMHTSSVLAGTDVENINLRKESENPVITTPTGIALDYFIDNNWTVGTGIGWAEYGEGVDYNLVNVTSAYDSIAIDGRYDSPSNYPNIVSIDSTRVIDTVNQGHWNYNLVYRTDDSTVNKYQGKNVFRYIEVPVTVGYRFGSGKVKPWIKGGIIVGLPVEANYSYPISGMEAFSSEAGTSKLASVQYSGMLQLGVDAYLSRSFSLRVNTFGSYQLNSMITADGIRQRYYRLGVSIGLAYNF